MSKVKTIADMRRDSLAVLLYNRVKDGENRTINEWAEEFDVMPSTIQRALSRLRKVNCHLHPVGGSQGANPTPGKVRDIMDNQDNFIEVYERVTLNQVNPGIRSLLSKSEEGHLKFPNFTTLLKSNLRYFSGLLMGIVGTARYRSLSNGDTRKE